MKRPSMHMAVWPLVVAMAVALAACSASHQEHGAPTGAGVAAATTVVAPATATVYSTTPGNVVAVQSVRIASRLAGYVRVLAVDVGDHVKAGALLLTIDNRSVEARIAQARAALIRARAAYADADFNYIRYSNLYREQAVSRQQYEAIRRNYTAARASVSAARAGVAQAESQRAYAEVRAPFAGVVTARYVQQGDLAMPGAPLLALLAPGNLEVHAQITNHAYAALKLGDKVEVRGNGVTLEASVTHLSPAADPATETHLLKAALPAGTKFGPGDYVRVLVPVGQRKALFVPATAVVERTGIPEVFVVNSAHRVHLRMVRVGEHLDGKVAILAGLVSGERIVTRPGDALANGSLIRPEVGDGA